MHKIRQIEELIDATPTVEGAGVNLKRVFANSQAQRLDPFLLLDHFGSDNPADYLAGFPWHPHRGIETVTYMLSGTVEHQDSIGNQGNISSGDVQWMTAGSGIIHQEMPLRADGILMGFQLWVNLPRQHKMMAPRYRGFSKSEIPKATISDGVAAKVICGQIGGVRGPVRNLMVDVEVFDVLMEPHRRFTHTVGHINTTAAFVFAGSGFFAQDNEQHIDSGTLALFADGDTVVAETDTEPMRFLFLSGKPLAEPIAWGGPIVMNTTEELNTAFRDYQEGTFIRSSRPGA
jgi:redox-sensitive bicupin YhaK (pirin superfamily)